jgi:hypothetical protein
MASQTVTLGAQTSGDDDRTGEPILELRRLLAKHCTGPYCTEVDEFALILRIGGNMQESDFEGCERLRRNRKGKYITVDLGFPSRRWRRASNDRIRAYLAGLVEKGLLCCIQRLEKDKVRVDSTRLLADFHVAKSLFLARTRG